MPSLRDEIETALTAHIAANVTGANVYAGVSNQDKEGPCIVCFVSGMAEDPVNSGNFRASFQTVIKAGADTLATLSDQVRDAICNNTFAADLNSQGTNLYVFGASDVFNVQPDVSEEFFNESWNGEIYACLTG